jgi:hypothetical protein
MKKYLVILFIMAVTLMMAGLVTPASAQNPTSDTPTFYRLVPGTYVNGWPRFTVHYPKDWAERPVLFPAGEVLSVSPPGPARFPALSVVAIFYPFPLEQYAEFLVSALKQLGLSDVTVMGDRPTQLKDGTPAQEIEIHFVNNGILATLLNLATKKGGVLIRTGVGTDRAKVGDDLKTILYSLEFQPGHDEPVKVPPDVREFLDRHCRAAVAHDLAQVMASYSDRYLNSGVRKGEMERFHRPIIAQTTSYEIAITDFVPEGERAYLAGFVAGWWGKTPFQDTSIIKENGQWKWYGNQRDVAR